MAVEVVNKKQTGSAGTSTLSIVKPTAGNWLVACVNQASTIFAPTGKDNTGTAGWSLLTETHATLITTNSGYLLWKMATGSEEKLEPTAGTAGSVVGISYVEIAGLGASPSLDMVQHIDNQANSTALDPGGGVITTTDAGDIVLGFVLLSSGSGTVSAWTGSPFTNVETVTTRVIGGYAVPGSTGTYSSTAHWETNRNVGGIEVAIKPTATAASGSVVGVV